MDTKLPLSDEFTQHAATCLLCAAGAVCASGLSLMMLPAPDQEPSTPICRECGVETDGEDSEQMCEECRIAFEREQQADAKAGAYEEAVAYRLFGRRYL